jgi:class 3 adenylate cyclase
VPVNIASRLTDLAPPGKIWAAEEIASISANSLSWTSLGLQEIKGCTEPLPVFELDVER